jgi:hypothetical protein
MHAVQKNLWQTANTVLGGNLATYLAECSSEGKSSRSIAAELAERGVFVSHPTVAMWLREHRAAA